MARKKKADFIEEVVSGDDAKIKSHLIGAMATKRATQAQNTVKALRAELVRRGVDVEAIEPPKVRDFSIEPTILHDGNREPLHDGQREAWASRVRVVAVFAGWQSGKSVLGPDWLMREMQECGPGDYFCITPTFPLMDNKAKPLLLQELSGIIRSSGNNLIITPRGVSMLGWSRRTSGRILLRHAEDPNSLEAFTAKGGWVDEAGDIPDQSWRVIQSRVAVNKGRLLLTSRPYSTTGWYTNEIWNKRYTREDLKVVNYSSFMNPHCDVEFVEREREVLPKWKFDMLYMGIPGRPAGQVFDCFERGINTCRRFAIPNHWRRFVGIDFGPQNTFAVFFAAEQDDFGLETGRMILYKTHYGPGLTVEEHIVRMMAGEPRLPRAWGGNITGEQSWRGWFTSLGFPISQPLESRLEYGIQAVYSLMKTARLVIFDDLDDIIGQVETYVYETDELGNPIIDKIKDKSKYHGCDALRYVVPSVYRLFGKIPELIPELGTMAMYKEFERNISREVKMRSAPSSLKWK